MFNPDREIAVSWASQAESQFDADLEVTVEDRTGMLARVVASIANLKTNIRNFEARTSDGRGIILLTVEIADLKHLERVIRAIAGVEGVLTVQRRYNSRQSQAD
jgi:GTP pyrophosphokinase